MTEADVSLIPKSLEDKGKTLTLGDVKWSESTEMDGEGNPITRYTATASYTGTATSRYATGYTVTANYTGEVAKADCSVVTYTAIFGSESAQEEPEASGADEKDGADRADGTAASEAPDILKQPVDLSGLKRPLTIGGVVLVLAVGGMFAFKKFKERR